MPRRRIARYPFRQPLLIAALLLAASPRPQSTLQEQERPQFRTGLELVQLDVSVLDRDRRPAVGVDPTGREIGSSTKSMAVTFNTATGSEPAETNVQTNVQLPPGDYEIRMAVADPATDTVASVFAPLRVPRFADEPLSLSDVIVDSNAGVPPSTTPGETNVGPTTRRTFDRNERVRARVQVSQGTGNKNPRVATDVRMRIVDATGRAVRDRQVTLTDSAFVSRVADASVDLSGLAVGSYVLTIDANIPGHAASHAVPFSVR